MGTFLEKRAAEAPEPLPGSDSITARRPQRPPVFSDFRFVPARWLVALLAVFGLLFRGAKLNKLGIAGLVWSFTPRTLKLAAAGFAVAGAIVLVGAIAAIALLALRLS